MKSMKDNLINALKRLLIHSIDPKNLSPDLEGASLLQDDAEDAPEEQIHFVKNMSNNAYRILDPVESARFSADALDFLYFIEQLNLFSGEQREHLLDELMALPNETLSQNDIKWEILNLLDPETSEEQRNFLDFLLTKNVENKH
jgi:uncharacterized protein Smg (DUF494 family)